MNDLWKEIRAPFVIGCVLTAIVVGCVFAAVTAVSLLPLWIGLPIYILLIPVLGAGGGIRHRMDR